MELHFYDYRMHYFWKIFFIITRKKILKTPPLPSTTKNNVFCLALSKLNGRIRLSSRRQGSWVPLTSCSHFLCSFKESQVTSLLTQNLPVVLSHRKSPSPSNACGVLCALLQPCNWRHLLLAPLLTLPQPWGPLRVPAHLRECPFQGSCACSSFYGEHFLLGGLAPSPPSGLCSNAPFSVRPSLTHPILLKSCFYFSSYHVSDRIHDLFVYWWLLLLPTRI